MLQYREQLNYFFFAVFEASSLPNIVEVELRHCSTVAFPVESEYIITGQSRCHPLAQLSEIDHFEDPVGIQVPKNGNRFVESGK